MTNQTRTSRSEQMFQLIEKFTEVDLHPRVVANHTMGQVFEELLRRFSEMSNETSGEHYTSRDIVRLLVAMVFSENKEDLLGEGKIRTLFDCCSGTGGMLTIGKVWVLENINPNIDIILYGQELNPQTYSICKSDLHISGENPDYYISVRKDVLEEIDGPMLKYGIQSMDKQRIILPKRKTDWPDKERLEVRFTDFLKTV